jgi:hypothetical protein
MLTLILAALVASLGAWLLVEGTENRPRTFIGYVRRLIGALIFSAVLGFLSFASAPFVVETTLTESTEATSALAVDANVTEGEACRVATELACEGCLQQLNFQNMKSCIQDGVSHCLMEDSPLKATRVDRRTLTACLESARDLGCSTRTPKFLLCLLAGQLN